MKLPYYFHYEVKSTCNDRQQFSFLQQGSQLLHCHLVCFVRCLLMKFGVIFLMLNVFWAWFFLFCKVCSRFLWSNAFIRKTKTQTSSPRNRWSRQLIAIFDWIQLLKNPRWFAVKIQHESFWNQNKENFTIWKHSKRLPSRKIRKSIINNNCQLDELNNRIVVGHCYSILSCASCSHQLPSEIATAMSHQSNKWLI